MGRASGFLIKCRCGVFVDLKIQAKKDGDGRFYRVHPDKKGNPPCRGREDFNPEITTVEDLKAIYPELTIKPDKPTQPLKPENPQPEPQEESNNDSLTTFFS